MTAGPEGTKAAWEPPGTTGNLKCSKCSSWGRGESLAVFVRNAVVEPASTGVELVSPSGDIVPTSVETVSLSGGIVSLVGETVSTTVGIVSLSGEIVSLHGEIVPTTVETVSTGGDMISTDDEIVPLNSETMPTDDETVPLTVEMVSTDGETVSTAVETVLTIDSRRLLPCVVVLHRRGFLRPVRHRLLPALTRPGKVNEPAPSPRSPLWPALGRPRGCAHCRA